jgi:alanine dehydrogenase
MLFLTEADVQQLLPMSQAIERVEASFAAQARGEAVNRSRERILLPATSLHYMAAALPEENLLGMKIYTVSSGALRFMVLLYGAGGGELLALIEADHLGRIRTGAASGVATKYLARKHADRVGVIGAGRQARTQLEAVSHVRNITAVKVFSPNPDRRGEFCRAMAARLQLTVEPAESTESAARFGQIVITATSAREPVVMGEWLAPGTHVNAIGANMKNRREVDDATLARAGVIAVDSLEQAKEEAGDLIQGLPSLLHGWDDVVEFQEVLSGRKPGRTSDQQLTLFKSSGIAIWDVAVASFIYRQAVAQGRGKRIAIWGEE